VTAVVGCVALACAGEVAAYHLHPWPYGAIAWVGESPVGCVEYAAAATSAVEDVFDLWGFGAPDAMANWEAPCSLGAGSGLSPVVGKTDPATGEPWHLTALRWEHRPAFPLLLVVFPDRASLVDALGAEHEAAFLGAGHLFSCADPWLMLLSDAPRCVVVSREPPPREGYTGEFVLTHELAHWMTQLHCLKIDLDMDDVPLLPAEGIAE